MLELAGAGASKLVLFDVFAERGSGCLVALELERAQLTQAGLRFVLIKQPILSTAVQN